MTIHAFDEKQIQQPSLAGGKGGTLARLYQARYPVPDGFTILPDAFAGDTLKPAAQAQLLSHLDRLRRGDEQAAFAVRSSALCEDSARASFAGEFETVLDIRTDRDILNAIHTVRRSRHSERVQAYSTAQGIDSAHEMAVVVQKLVQANFAGVLFTADPVSGSRAAIHGNFCRGLGEKLVSGTANAASFVLARPKGAYDGPPELEQFAARLYKLATRLENELGGPQDIEWAIADRKLWLLQSRPITTLQTYNPETGERNDSLSGDFLWTSANFGEAFPDVITLFTWSIVEAYIKAAGMDVEAAQYPMIGNIGGRLYMNISLGLSAVAALGLSHEKALRTGQETFGRIPPDVEIPLTPLSRRWILQRYLPVAFRRKWQAKRLKPRLPAFVAETPALVSSLQAEIDATRSSRQLLNLWQTRLQPLLEPVWQILIAGLTEYRTLSRKLHIEFDRLLGEADANALLSGVSTEADHLASLGPLIGLYKVRHGDMSRQDYIEQYGHRGPHEAELSIPRPEEDPGWLSRRLAEIDSGKTNIPDLLAQQRQRHQAAWERLKQKVPRKARAYRQKLERMAAASKTREAVRSEGIRLLGVFRRFALRAGELTGLGQDIFFLSAGEITSLLDGDPAPTKYIPARRETYARYCALPPYPTLIRGRFDPVQWAADPNRRSDFYHAYAPPDAHTPPIVPTSGIVTGFAGAAGVVEGIACRLDSMSNSSQFQPGQVLVTTTTNVGWTPLFPCAAAIVTDVGAPFSHAAIVARELGIPAVVGCGNATMLIHTGDRVRVNGGRGTVEILKHYNKGHHLDVV